MSQSRHKVGTTISGNNFMKGNLFQFKGVVFILILIFAFFLAGGFIFAQEVEPVEIPEEVQVEIPEEVQEVIEEAAEEVIKEEQKLEEVKIDTTINPEDLEVGKARILPDSPFYGLKNFARGLRRFFTFNPVNRADLDLRFTNEKIIEAMQLIEEKGTEESIEKATNIIEEAGN